VDPVTLDAGAAPDHAFPGLPLYRVCGDVLRVVDGDTVWIECDFGPKHMPIRIPLAIRLHSIDCSETRGTTGKVLKRAREAVEFVERAVQVSKQWAEKHGHMKRNVYLEHMRYDKYRGRHNATLHLYDSTGLQYNLGNALIQAGLADPKKY
jgi:endonuclease YncB( thermonuclease family)